MSHALLPLVLALITQAEPQKPSPVDVVAALESALADAIARAEGSVVAISRIQSENKETTAIRGQNPAPFVDEAMIAQGRFGQFQPQSDVQAFPGEFGSGVVVGDKGEILTVYHLVLGARQINVRAPGRQQFQAEILAADPRSDLAVIVPRESANPPNLKPIPLGDASKLRPGHFLLALGNPYNAAKDGRASASWGILANTARRMEKTGSDQTALSESENFRYRATLLQLDAKLNLGMSGGAVINLKGELVGITTAAGSPSGFDAQAGYAIPMDALGRKAVDTLKQGKEVEYAFLGIRLDNRTPNTVGEIEPGTPAAEGKLVQNDLIVEINGVPVVGEDGLALALSTAPVGKPVSVKVMREGTPFETFVVVSKYPIKTGQPIATNRPSAWRGIRVDFTSVLSGSTMSNDILTMMKIGGVGVVDVEIGSAADQAGLKKGQIILSVDGAPVRTPAAFVEAVAKIRGPAKLETIILNMPRTVTIPDK